MNPSARPGRLARTDFGRSWMAPNTSYGELLYVTDEGTNDVYVYSWPQLQLVGTLTGFAYPQGDCADAKGNVWIVDFGTSEVIEYAHGGTQRIATLSNVGYDINACAVDPTTGDLAVTVVERNGSSSGGSGGYVVIYKHARGKPNVHSASIGYPSFCAYDPKGNLFVDGSGDINPWDEFELSEIHARTGNVTPISVNQNMNYSGGVQWHGRYVVIGDTRSNAIYKFAIRGAYGYLNGTTPLAGASSVLQFAIIGRSIVGPNAGDGTVGIWPFPRGGAPAQTLSGFAVPIAAVLSRGR